MKYSPFRHIGSLFRKRDPIHLTLFVTGRCNANCPFCFYLSQNGNGNKGRELSLDELEKVSLSMGNLLWLAFSGGEISLREDIADIANIFYRNNRPAMILLSTNGLLPDRIKDLTEAILRRCSRSTIIVKLSLDGPESIHDSLRGVNGAYLKVMRTYELLGGLLETYDNFELGINTVFCSANQNCMDETLHLVHGLEHIRTHTVSLVRGDASYQGIKDVDMDKYGKTIKKMTTQLRNGSASIYGFRGARLKAAQDILQRRLILETTVQKKRLIPCYAGRLNLVISETGDVYPCESFASRIGNVREAGYDMNSLLRSQGAQEVIGSIQKGNCYCTHECYMMTNILFNPSFYPSLMKEVAGL